MREISRAKVVKTITPDQEYTFQKIFQDYINKRDQLRKAAEWPDAVLTARQEAVVRTAAREQFRLRETAEFKRWLCRFFAETNMYLTAINIKSWPMMRTMK